MAENKSDALALKIRRLVEERGWTQLELADRAKLNRHTARSILLPGPQRRLRARTVQGCARALGLRVSDLKGQPLDRLLRLVNDDGSVQDPARRALLDRVEAVLDGPDGRLLAGIVGLLHERLRPGAA
jgi:transcriptional regulator with XRE-family HTH domain